MSIKKTFSKILGIWFLTWGISTIGVTILSSPKIREEIKRSARPLINSGKWYMRRKEKNQTISSPIEEDIMFRYGLKERLEEIEEEISEIKNMISQDDLN